MGVFCKDWFRKEKGGRIWAHTQLCMMHAWQAAWRASERAGGPAPLRSGSVMTGVLILDAAVIRISRRRGMPSVTFASPRPAMWNVLSVICVDGSPAWQCDKKSVRKWCEKSA